MDFSIAIIWPSALMRLPSYKTSTVNIICCVRLWLVLGKYKEKKKIIKENDFLIFGYLIKYSKKN